MIADEIAIITKTAKRLGMPTTQVARVVDVYLDEHLAASRASRVAADLAEPTPTPAEPAKRVRKAAAAKVTMDQIKAETEKP